MFTVIATAEFTFDPVDYPEITTQAEAEAYVRNFVNDSAVSASDFSFQVIEE